MAVLFYSNNECPSESKKFIGDVSTSSTESYDLKDSGAPVPNDEARSCTLVDVKANTVISVYDSPGGDQNDDWTQIVVKEDLDSLCISTFEQNQSTSQITMTYNKDNGLDGKISRIDVTAP